MKKTKLIAVVLLALVLVFALGLATACENHKCEHVCPICNKCTSDCTDPACADKCAGHQTTPTAPVITVNPATLTIYAGDEIDLMFGVTVTDANDENPTLIIFDDGEFDADTEGTYTIVYKAVNKDKLEATATRTITVEKALSALALEVKQNLLGENKWKGVTVTFKNSLYKEISVDTNVEVPTSGVWHNTSDNPVTLSVAGGYGCSAIITANGVVVEGRDGANSRLMNQENPSRASSAVTTITVDGEDVSVSGAFAKNMQIPAGGYAVVIQSNYAGTTADTDGRGFINYNVIYSYGNVVRLMWVDSSEVITPYVDQAPVISGYSSTIYALLGDKEYDLNKEVLTGVSAKDDNGTFEIKDDVAVTVTVHDNGGFNVDNEGEYMVTLKAVDDKNLPAEVTRKVVVTASLKTIMVESNYFRVLPEELAVDKDLTVVGNYKFIVYTPAYEGELGFNNGYGVAFVLDKYGKIVRIYDGANGKYYDAENKNGVVDATKCTAKGYAEEAFASRQDGEYVVIAPNSGANVHRAFLLSNRSIGGRMTLPDITFEAKTYTFTVGTKSFTATEDKYVVNTAVTADTAAKYSMIVYTKSFTDTVVANGYGVAIVLDKYGTVVKLYDGANSGFYTVDGKSTDTLTFTPSNYATVAFSELADGEMLIIFPNDGVNGETSPRTFALGLRTDGSIGKKVTLTDCVFVKNDKTIVIGDKSYTAAEGTWAYNEAVTATNAATKSMIIFDKTYSGEVTVNAYGVAIVLDKYGTVVKLYDGANSGFYTVDGKSTDTLTFTPSNYATVAFSELADGEMLIIFPNDGVNGETSPRTFALGLRTDGSIGKKASLTGVEFAVDGKLTIGENSIAIDADKVAINTTTANSSDYEWYIFTTQFAGKLNFVNGWGAATVVDANNQIVRVYSGADGKLYTEDNPQGEALASADYLTIALSSLKANEWMIVGVNNSANQAPRDFLRNNKTIGATVDLPGVDIPLGDKDMATVTVGKNNFYTTAVAVNADVDVSKHDFVVYTYGYNGVVVNNGYAEAFVIKDGKIVRIYDGVNNKYYDADNSTGVVNTSDAYYSLKSVSLAAFESLQPGETLVVGLNGGLDSNRARAFLVANRSHGSTMTLTGVTATAGTEKINYVKLTVGNKTWFQDSTKMAINADYEGTPVFAIYDYGFTGTTYTGGYGVAFVVDKATGKTVKVYDGASAKYWDAENKGVSGICTAAGYAAEAFAALEEGQYVLIAPNQGFDGNLARALLYSNRNVDVAVSYTVAK